MSDRCVSPHCHLQHPFISCSSFSHILWIDASSHESMTMSLKGISSIPAAHASGVDGSVESVLQWISCIKDEWLMVFDNADDPAPEDVAKFFPSGSRGNILITSRNRSMGRIISFENSIHISEMGEADAISLLLNASCLDPAGHVEAARKIVAELGCIPLAVNHAGAYIEAGKCDIRIGTLQNLKLSERHRYDISEPNKKKSR
ncbi:hypothetical protein BYT27DRAFT_7086200 [Phlegmacium glaucopus]|nr:hypothetical protein BYT27DRAFT_7086200 [Phlegmacium glaucopus]